MPDPDYSGLIDKMISEAGAAFDACIDDWVDGARRSAARLEGGYKADELAQDMADYWVRMLRSGARFADIWRRMPRPAPRPPERPPARAATPTPLEL